MKLSKELKKLVRATEEAETRARAEAKSYAKMFHEHNKILEKEARKK